MQILRRNFSISFNHVLLDLIQINSTLLNFIQKQHFWPNFFVWIFFLATTGNLWNQKMDICCKMCANSCYNACFFHIFCTKWNYGWTRNFKNNNISIHHIAILSVDINSHGPYTNVFSLPPSLPISLSLSMAMSMSL